jgi:ParB family transcriptional regulator, chromosome partitioning protein
MDRKGIKVVQSAKRDDVQHKMVHVKDIRTPPTFANLLRIDPAMREEITQSMRGHGFFPSHPITMGTWPGQDEPVVIEGHTRRDAALEAGIAVVPVVISAFKAVMAALERAVSLQAQHRFSTNGAYYRMCVTYDTLAARGGDRRIERAK